MPTKDSTDHRQAQSASGPAILITGVGQVSPLGQSAWETFRALLAGHTISNRLAEMPEGVDLVDQVRACGGVKTAQHSATDPAIDLAERAAREALQDAGYGNRPFDGPCFVGTSKGCVTAWSAANHPAGLSRANLHPQDAALATILGPHGYLSHHLSQRLGLSVERNIVAACASSLIALDTARRYLLTTPGTKRAIVVTSESALLPLFIHAYRRLGVLCPVDQYVARPFAPEQHGFTLGEQAAAVVLQRADVNDDTPTSAHAQLLTTAAYNDPHDLIRTNPEGLALRRVAQQVLGHTGCDALLAHAPGTQVHEAVELAAVQAAQQAANLPTSTPPVYALKGAIGHGLGASGLMSLVTACLCGKAKRLPPMPWLPAPGSTPTTAEENGVQQIIQSACQAGQPLPPSPRIAVFAAGFAGHTAGAMIQCQ